MKKNEFMKFDDDYVIKSLFEGLSLSRPSTSPSRMGSLMWGSETPLSLKGEVPHTAVSGK